MFFAFKFGIINDIIKRFGEVEYEYTGLSKNDTS